MTAESSPLVSILTPVYNGAEHLAECIESVLAQTYQNWDYTIVDNCSTDSSVQIARRYAAKDPRIRVHQNQQFVRAIPNHNVALRQISPAAKYCKMVFADDWIFPECLEKMVAAAEEHPSVGVVGAYALQGTQVLWTGLPYPSRIVSGREICRRHFLENLYVFGTPNCVLYRADLVRRHNPFYNEANIHADTEVCFAVLKTCDFGFVHQVLTFTRMRPGSLATISEDLQTDLAGMLQTLTAHGPAYLTGAEFDRLLTRHLSQYYRFLGKNLIMGRSKEFWKYHKGKLNEAGYGVSRTRLMIGLGAALGLAALKPRETIKKLLKRRDDRSIGEGNKGAASNPSSISADGR
jgi:glycosyltransferase involved in cell wall biosynthesis